MKTQTLYFLNRLIGRGEKFLLETMIRCEKDELFNHKLESEMFWSINFPYQYINNLKIKALAKICDDLKEEIRQKTCIFNLIYYPHEQNNLSF